MTERKIILDTETTGLSINNGDRVIEIGCVEVIGLCITGRVFHAYVNPETQESSKEAIKVHGITKEMLEEKPVFKEIAEQFCDFIQDDYVVAHNATFDVNFLNYELKRAKVRKLIRQENVVDTLKIARRMFPGAPASLDALCKRFKISLEQRKLHGALLDAQLLARIYLELSNGSQSNIFQNSNDNADSNSIKRRNLDSRRFENSEDELSAHKEFITKLNNPIWDNLN